MLQEFTLAGVTYIRVEIPLWMYASKLIEEHIHRGDVFALDKRTGRLTVISARTWKMANEMATRTTLLVNPADPVPPEVDVQFYRKKLREISASAKAALGE